MDLLGEPIAGRAFALVPRSDNRSLKIGYSTAWSKRPSPLRHLRTALLRAVLATAQFLSSVQKEGALNWRVDPVIAENLLRSNQFTAPATTVCRYLPLYVCALLMKQQLGPNSR